MARHQRRGQTRSPGRGRVRGRREGALYQPGRSASACLPSSSSAWQPGSCLLWGPPQPWCPVCMGSSEMGDSVLLLVHREQIRESLLVLSSGGDLARQVARRPRTHRQQRGGAKPQRTAAMTYRTVPIPNPPAIIPEEQKSSTHVSGTDPFLRTSTIREAECQCTNMPRIYTEY